MITNADADQDMESPCVSACMVDQQHGYCVACWRTLREISDWHKYDPAQKRAVLAGLETRRATHSNID
jgi:uncharacterized protein